jgi:hypothetical protein
MGAAFHLAWTGDDRERMIIAKRDGANGDDRGGRNGLIQDGFLCCPTMPGSGGGINPA